MEKSINDDTWFASFKESADYQTFKEKPIAYFCSEYALSPNLPTYAGGLGVFAGDMVREAGAQQLPVLFIGLYYKHGQSNIVPKGAYTNEDVNLTLVTDEENERIVISVPLHGRQVSFQVWRWSEGKASVYLLDTDIPENKKADDRAITDHLYAEDRTVRLKQELLLGVGGFRFIRKLGYHPSVYHLNEGHSAFLALELVHHEMEHQHVDFSTACSYASKHILFTNHTLVAAGQELFTTELVTEVIESYAKEVKIPVANIVTLGMVEESGLFSMTMFSFRFSSKANAVSVLHKEKAFLIWPDHPMDSVTNGIYLPRWDKIKHQTNVWDAHQENKKKLLAYVKETTGESWGSNILLFGWARRFVQYKQPLAFIEEIDRVVTLATDSNRPFRIVFSGPTNDDSDDTNESVKELKKVIKEKLSEVAVFLPTYNIALAELMVAGCDVWLNTPMIGSEACGTSGMKAALNGVIPLSTRDGWVAEIDGEGHGWIVDEPNLGQKLLDVTEKDILPLYYGSQQSPGHSGWLTYMKNCRELISERFSTERALREYIERFYIPILQQKHTRRYE